MSIKINIEAGSLIDLIDFCRHFLRTADSGSIKGEATSYIESDAEILAKIKRAYKEESGRCIPMKKHLLFPQEVAFNCNGEITCGTAKCFACILEAYKKQGLHIK